MDGWIITDGHDRARQPGGSNVHADVDAWILIQRLESHAHVRVLTSGWMRIHRLRWTAGVDGMMEIQRPSESARGDGTMAIGRSTATARENGREEDPAGWTESNGSSQARARPKE